MPRSRLAAGAPLALLAAWLAACGGGGSGPNPGRIVAGAARETFRSGPAAVVLKVASPGVRYRAHGQIEPASGRFRLRVAGRSHPRVPARREYVVLGTSGEGAETTYFVTHGLFGRKIVTHGPIGRDLPRCWFNPHFPVGSYRGTASVEESVRLVGSVLESLRREIATASASSGEDDAGDFAVTLRPSATHPRSDFDDRRRRVWGSRKLLTKLDGPIGLALSDERAIAGVALELHGYGGNVLARQQAPRSVSIRANLSPTSGELRLHPPRCQAME